MLQTANATSTSQTATPSRNGHAVPQRQIPNYQTDAQPTEKAAAANQDTVILNGLDDPRSHNYPLLKSSGWDVRICSEYTAASSPRNEKLRQDFTWTADGYSRLTTYVRNGRSEDAYYVQDYNGVRTKGQSLSSSLT